MGYTVEQLEDMLANAQLSQSIEELAVPAHFIYEDAILAASDLTETTYNITSGSFSISAGRRIKSESEDKHLVQQKYYIRETRQGSTIAHSLQATIYHTGSYSDSIDNPTIQIIRTREIDMRILKG
jgi:hypothetical protein